MSFFVDGDIYNESGRLPLLSPVKYVDGRPPVNVAGGGGGGGNWTEAGGYLHPTLGAGEDVVIGSTSAPVGSEKLRVEGHQRLSGQLQNPTSGLPLVPLTTDADGNACLVLGDLVADGGTANLRYGWGSVLPTNGKDYGGGSQFTDVVGKTVYVNRGTAASVNWLSVGTITGPA